MAFRDCGYEASYGKVTLSNRPDLCEYQCNGAMAAAKAYKKKPIEIAQAVVEKVKESSVFEDVNAVMPGFINLKIDASFLADYMNRMCSENKFGMDEVEKPETVIVDYGGANVAKPLHVGHLQGGRYRRSNQAHGPVRGPYDHRRRASWRLGPADGT